MHKLISENLQAITVITNTWKQSIRFYTDGLGYGILEEGSLTENQRNIFGKHLKKYVLLGHTEGSVLRLIETSKKNAIPNRVGAKAWDNGLVCFECGTPDVEKAYFKVIRNKFGAIAPPTEFDCEGPEPLGKILMRSTAFIGPAGEQIFVTQIVNRIGGVSLLKEKAVDGINTPANAVMSLKTRKQQEWYKNVLGIVPVNDLLLKQDGAAAIMAGHSGMAFDMCLMGYDLHRIGLEQHIYQPNNQGLSYKIIPTDFRKTGLVAATFKTDNLDFTKDHLQKNNCKIISEIGLPIRGNKEPKAVVFRGLLGEIFELIS